MPWNRYLVLQKRNQYKFISTLRFWQVVNAYFSASVCRLKQMIAFFCEETPFFRVNQACASVPFFARLIEHTLSEKFSRMCAAQKTAAASRIKMHDLRPAARGFRPFCRYKRDPPPEALGPDHNENRKNRRTKQKGLPKQSF